MLKEEAKSNDIVIDSEYAYIQTFINFLKQIIEIIAGLFEKMSGALSNKEAE